MRYALLTDKERQTLRRRVIAYRNKGKVPTVELQEQYGISRNVADHLLRAAVADGLLEHSEAFVARRTSRKGNGLVVVAPIQPPLPFIEQPLPDALGMLEVMVPEGYETVLLHKPKHATVTVLMELS